MFRSNDSSIIITSINCIIYIIRVYYFNKNLRDYILVGISKLILSFDYRLLSHIVCCNLILRAFENYLKKKKKRIDKTNYIMYSQEKNKKKLHAR